MGSTPQRIAVNPGSAKDPERTRCFQAIQLACAGSTIGAALAAQIDSLACTAIVAAANRPNADQILESIARDLRRAVDDNWDLVKSQIAQVDLSGSERTN